MFRNSSILFLLLLVGCAKYGYEVVEPPSSAGHLALDKEITVTTANAEYGFRASGLRLLVSVINRGSAELFLDGDKSSVIAPNGQSRPIHDQTIPPGGVVQFYLPTPVRLVTGPSYPWLGRYDDWDEPLDRVGPDISSPYYFDWTGESQIAMTLIYARGGDEVVEDHFIIQRRKAR